jgi:hypothetical protein
MNTEDNEEIVEGEPIQLDELKKIAKYSTLDIIKALKIPRERLRDWIVRGFISPSLPSCKQGVKAGFSDADIYGIAIFEKLLDYGYKREAASEIVKHFMGLNPISGVLGYVIFKHVIKDGKSRIDTHMIAGADINGLTKIVEEELINAENNPDEKWDSFHIMNVGEVIHKVDRALEKLE